MKNKMDASLSKKRLEELLSDILVPVEPSVQFVRRLRARLVTYQGRGPLSGWMVIVVIATVFLLAVTSIGLVVRIFLGLVSLIGLNSNRRRMKSEARVAT
ncbi:MAG: hypothetical protein KAR65_03785 [Anaerolineales bacterium]|nr:hypothetical protein [Anaerolineales bacterium]